MILVTFGLPGAGKTFTAQFIKKKYGYHLYDGDIDLTDEMKYAIKHKIPFTDEMRDTFFNRLITHVKKIIHKYPHIVITQTFIKEKYRTLFLKSFPQTVFFLIHADTMVREKRLRERVKYPLDEEYARSMVTLFEKPKLAHIVIDNTLDGEEHLIPQFHALLSV